MIYLDNAATTRPCPAALDAMRTALEDAWGNPSALYRPGQQARKLVEDARRTVARVLHAARPAEITFTSGGTESDVQALYTGAALGAAAGKRHIISTQIEHHAVLHTLQALQTQGFTVTLLPPSAAGLITAAAGGRLAAGHLPGQHHVCQQRNRHRAAYCGTWRPLPGARRAVPH